MSEIVDNITAIQHDLKNDPSVQNVIQYANDHSDSFSELIQQGQPATLGNSLAKVINGVTGVVKQKAQELVDVAAYSTGSEYIDISQITDENQLTLNKVTDITVNLDKGDSTMSAYLRTGHETVNGKNISEVDYSILSNLSYASKFCDDPEYQTIIQKENLTVREYCDELLECAERNGKTMSQLDRTFLQDMRDSSRFGDLMIDHSIGNTDQGSGEHTQVMVFGCGDGHGIVAIQGTNGTVKDWQTNGKFAGSEITDEEKWINAAVNHYASEYNSIDITGHSQGGREAVTAAMYLNSDNMDKLEAVYSNDGPGYSTDFILKHQDQIERISGKVTNICGTEGMVHFIENTIGKTKYVRTIEVPGDSTNNLIRHLSTNWLMTPDGQYVEGEDPGLFSWATVTETTIPITEFLFTVLPEDKAQTYIDSFVTLTDDGSGKMSFSSLISWDTVKLLFQFKDDLQMGIYSMGEDQLDPLAYDILLASGCLASAASEVSVVLKIAAFVSAKVPGLNVAAPILAMLSEGTSIIKYTAMTIEILLAQEAYKREREKREIRVQYIAAKGEIYFDYEAFQTAWRAILHVEENLIRANIAMDEMKIHFKKTIKETIINALGLEEQISHLADVNILDAKVHCMIHGVKNISDTRLNRLNDLAVKLEQIALRSTNILTPVMNEIQMKYTTQPSSLSNSAVEGDFLCDSMMEQINTISESITQLGQSWTGEDYQAESTAINNVVEQYRSKITGLKNEFSRLNTIAALHSKFQMDTIEEFQNVRI